MEIRCANCGKLNRLPDAAAGKKIVCGNCRKELQTGGSGEVLIATDANFADLVRDRSVVDFWAPWCGPCRAIAPVVESLAREKHDIRFAKLNVDENRATAGRLQVSGIPTLIFFSESVERGRIVGAVGRQQIEQAIARYLPGQ